jgi:hypothetical protein
LSFYVTACSDFIVLDYSQSSSAAIKFPIRYIKCMIASKVELASCALSGCPPSLCPGQIYIPETLKRSDKEGVISEMSTELEKNQNQSQQIAFCAVFRKDNLSTIAVTHLQCFSSQIAPSRSQIMRTFYCINELYGIESIAVITERSPIKLPFAKDMDSIRVTLTYLNQRYSTSPF